MTPGLGGMAAPKLPPIGGAMKPPAPAAAPAMPAAPTAGKLAYEFGALHALKTAARMGTTVPTGYRFDPNQEWLAALSETARPQATERIQQINDWLAQQGGSLGGGFAQNPAFARHMVALAQLAKANKALPSLAAP